MKNSIIIFGAGYYGKSSYELLKDKYNVICFLDNDNRLYGKEYDGKEILSPDKIDKKMMNDIDIIICSSKYYEIASQITDRGILSYYVMIEGMLFHCDSKEMMIPVEISNGVYHKENRDEKNILFVQNAVCIRTLRIATIMKEAGYIVHLLYTVSPVSKSYLEYDVFDYKWNFTSLQGIVDFVNNSDFDLVHCSNEPDILANLLCRSNKTVVADTHDMQSIRGNIGIDTLVLEYMANTKPDGNMYPSDRIAEIAQVKYKTNGRFIQSIDNLVMDEIDIYEPHKKISDLDGQFHCVYEGGIVGLNKDNHRFFDEIWKKITDCGIHIHFYSQSDLKDCKRMETLSNLIHYEGNVGGEELIKSMTKYDCGLALFNSNGNNRLHLEAASINKVYEYLNSGLPIISYGIDSLREFLRKNNVGDEIDLNGNIREQVKYISNINIPKGFLKKNGYTVRSHSAELLQFYERLISTKEETS